MQDDIFGVDAGAKFALDVDATHLELGHRDGLRSEHVPDLGGTDAEGDGSEGTVSGGVG